MAKAKTKTSARRCVNCHGGFKTAYRVATILCGDLGPLCRPCAEQMRMDYDATRAKIRHALEREAEIMVFGPKCRHCGR